MAVKIQRKAVKHFFITIEALQGTHKSAKNPQETQER